MPLRAYVGVDLSAEMTAQGRERFGMAGRFVCSDFLAFSEVTTETFDVLLAKQTLIFLEQPYLQTLLNTLAIRKVVDWIVVQELQHARQGSISQLGNWGNVPQDYSHDYRGLCLAAGFRLHSGGVDAVSDGRSSCRAVFRRV